MGRAAGGLEGRPISEWTVQLFCETPGIELSIRRLDYIWTSRLGETGAASGGTMIQDIERQFVRTLAPLYGHLVGLLESAHFARRNPVGCARAAGARAGAAAAHQPHHGRRRVSRAGVARPAARLCRTRHVRVRGARSDRRALRLARQDFGRGAALQRFDAARHDPPFVGCPAAVARRRRTGDRLFPNRGVSACARSRDQARGARDLAARPDRGTAGAARGDRRTLRRAGRERLDHRAARSRDSICSRAVSSIPAMRSSSIVRATSARSSRFAPPAPS